MSKRQSRVVRILTATGLCGASFLISYIHAANRYHRNPQLVRAQACSTKFRDKIATNAPPKLAGPSVASGGTHLAGLACGVEPMDANRPTCMQVAVESTGNRRGVLTAAS